MAETGNGHPRGHQLLKMVYGFQNLLIFNEISLAEINILYTFYGQYALYTALPY